MYNPLQQLIVDTTDAPLMDDYSANRQNPLPSV